MSNRVKSAVCNLSSYAPSQLALSVLELGLNFNTSSAPDPKIKVVCAVEHAIGLVDHSEREDACTRVISVLTKLPRKPPSALLPEQRNAIKSPQE